MSNQLYADYQRRLDARAVLEHYGAQNVHEEVNDDGTVELIHSCLLDRVQPHHKHGDQNPSAACNVDKGLYVCYSYWGGTLLRFIQMMEGKESIVGALPVISGLLSGATADNETWAAELDRMFATETGPPEMPSYDPRVLEPWLYTHPYMTEDRGISEDVCKALSLGYDETLNRIVFPHWHDGQLVGWQKRVIPERPEQWPGTPDQKPKYKNSSGFPKAETLYGIDHARATSRNHVVVVESPMSVAKAYTLGLPNVVATFGSKVTESQLDLLKDFRRVTVWFDDDYAGRGGQRKLIDGLYRHTDVRVVIPDERDLGDYDSHDEAVTTILGAMKATDWFATYLEDY